ncbi:hypothetical protein CYMTET_38469 [Cymbomonas tetramitiformis]|uniref:Uncharacterized protein n=1 Tax=Cymbomonas tetramitiformis TaxID=36881 RepID=A0AAE0CBY7_9CHLO|nr:hypothetical protein CYMTET_38469 [Cymbomonas tetramitiformis]
MLLCLLPLHFQQLPLLFLHQQNLLHQHFLCRQCCGGRGSLSDVGLLREGREILWILVLSTSLFRVLEFLALPCLWILLDLNGIELQARYIISEANEWADRLSRDRDLDDWRLREVNWVNPPWSLLDEVARKLREERCVATVVGPYWPGQMWFQQQEAMADEVAPQAGLTSGCKVKVYWPQDDAWYTGTVGDTGSDGLTHIAYEDGDNEDLDMSKESSLTELAVQMQGAALGDKMVGNYRPKARAFMVFCEAEGRQWLPATVAHSEVVHCPHVGQGHGAGVQHAALPVAINNYHEDMGFPGPAKGRAVSIRAVKGMSRLQVQAAEAAATELLKACTYVVFAFVTFGRPETGVSMRREHINITGRRWLTIPATGVAGLVRLLQHWQQVRDACWGQRPVTGSEVQGNCWSLPWEQGKLQLAHANGCVQLALGKLGCPQPSTPPCIDPAAVPGEHMERDSFDVQSSKTAATKVLGDKAAKFRGDETSASDIFSQLVSELQQLFTLQSTAFAPLFDLTAADTPVLPAANELLYSVLLLLTAPGSPARNWVEASGVDVPADGKRATLEVVRMLADASTPFDALTELLEVRVSDECDPDAGICLFNSCLRDAQRLTTLPEDAVKRQFLSALSGPAYATLVDSFARADPRAAVSLLTLQARVREQYRCGRLSGKQAHCRAPHPLPHSTSPEVAFDKRSGTFVPTCRHEKCRAVGSKHWLSECPHKDTHPLSISASYCQAVESYDSDVLALRFQRYYDAGDEGSMEHLCALVGQPEICELSAHAFAPEPTALQQFKDAAASAESAPDEHLSIGRVAFAAVSGPLAGGVAEPATDKRLLPRASAPVRDEPVDLHEVNRATFVPPSASLALGPMAPADSSFKTFNTVHPDWFDIDPEPVDVCDSDDDGEGSNYPPGVCLTEIEGGAPPTTAAFRRFGVPRGSRPFGIGEFALTLFMVATFLFSATAMPTLVVGGGVRGLVEPGATYGYDSLRSHGALLDSLNPPTVLTVSSLPLQDVPRVFSQSASATYQSDDFAIPLWDPPDPLGSGGVNIYDVSSQLTSDVFLPWDPSAELGSADHLYSG